MSTNVKTPVALSPIKDVAHLWMRGAMLLAALELGWAHQQVSTNVDVFTKGKGATAEVITLSWTATQLGGYSHSKGGKPVASHEGKVAGKLQRAQTQLGKAMAISETWKVTPKGKAQFKELAMATLKEIPLVKA
jgi:hypothetical protein